MATKSNLKPLKPRLELKRGLLNSSLLKSAYKLDYTNLENALNILNQQKKDKKIVIFTDFNFINEKPGLVLKTISLLNENAIDEVFFVGNSFTQYNEKLNCKSLYFNKLDDIVDQLQLDVFRNAAVLLNGEKENDIERFSALLEQNSHDTIVEINLHNLVSNYRFFKNKLNPLTKIMAMVKANAYGLGILEVAKTLEHYQVDYLGVAYVEEGVLLRKNGIKSPIVVMNPEQSSYDKIIEHGLEPEIYSIRVLEKFINCLKTKSLTQKYPIHIKIDSGMHRLGFYKEEIALLCQVLTENTSVEVKSVFSHLSTSDEQLEGDFTLSQIKYFEETYLQFTSTINQKPFKHILNTNGVLNYVDYQYDMVRLGIGLYDHSVHSKLKKVVELKTVISQIKTLSEGESVGYSRKFVADKPIKIAILPIGYADGLSRKLSKNGYKVSVNNTLCPIVGSVCMDMVMVDISLANCNEGDEVIVFGNIPTLKEFAQASETITYESLTLLSNRMKKIYYRK